MERLIIGAIASPGDDYDKMQQVWQDNVNRCSNKNIELYLLYADPTLDKNIKIVNLSDNVFKMYIKCHEIFESILYKTLEFFQWVLQNKKNAMVVRTNLSTMFELNQLYSVCNDFYKHTFFFGGTFVNGFCGRDTWFSGTNLTFSLPTLQLILNNKEALLNLQANDDVALSTIIFKKYNQLHTFCNIPRMDMTVPPFFQYCNLNAKVFCYRFKTNDRGCDAQLMRTFLDSNFDVRLLYTEIVKYQEKGEDRLALQLFTVS